MRIVADTNVIVSALVFGGLPRRIFELSEAGAYEFFYSPNIQDETYRVLKEKFLWEERRLASYLADFWKTGFSVVPAQRIEVVTEDPDDDRILECALCAQADVIVSGDRHLLKVGRFGPIRILSPRQFLNVYGRRSSQ
jgi:putative PIN family toxin of toxin-antitoxin system